MTPKQLMRYAVATILIGVLVFGGIYQKWHHTAQKPRTVNCADTLHTCRFTMDRQSVQVNFLEPPTGLHPFTLQVEIPSAHRIFASFTMPEMDMGNNRYRLLQKNAQLWQAQVILPVCMSGGHNWLLTLNIDGKTITIPFSAR
ncbi:MAG: hypothetical protein ACYCSS_08725 [Sulfuriferula sp.]